MIIPETPDPIGAAIKTINQCGEVIASTLAEQLTRIIDAGAPINSTLWSDPRIGTGGAALLGKLGAFVGLLATHFPERMNATLAGAGQNLTANADGTVTYTAPLNEEGGE